MDHRMKSILYAIAASLFAPPQLAAVDWSVNAKLPGVIQCEDHGSHTICFSDKDRTNVYELPNVLWQQMRLQGAKHALSYPVTITPLQIPFRNFEHFFNNNACVPLRLSFYKFAKEVSDFQSVNDVYDWLGLPLYPTTSQKQGPNPIPLMGELESHAMGVTIFENAGRGMTISCAGCHSENLFGTKVLGLSTRFPRANEFFIMGQKFLASTPTIAYRALLTPSEAEFELFKNSK
jgi:hypothetical protein